MYLVGSKDMSGAKRWLLLGLFASLLHLSPFLFHLVRLKVLVSKKKMKETKNNISRVHHRTR
jgi:hypothetical protein